MLMRATQHVEGWARRAHQKETVVPVQKECDLTTRSLLSILFWKQGDSF